MPPGRGFSGSNRRGSRGFREEKRNLKPLFILAGVPVVALIAWVGVLVTGSHDASKTSQAETSEGSPAAKATPTNPAVAPTRAPENRSGGLNEGSFKPPSATPQLPTNELALASSKRFSLPLTQHSGVEDYYGAPRGEGLIHAGVDFSLTGLKNIPVQSACVGEVTEIGTNDIDGVYVIVDCGDGFTTLYGFLASLRVGKGNGVSKSSVLGTGETDGHLHFEIRYHDVPIDPARVMQIPGKEITPWTPTPTPTSIPPTPTPTDIPDSTPTPPPTGFTPNGDETPVPQDPPTATPTPGPPTSTPTITPTPTKTPTPTRTPPKPTSTPTPPPRYN